MPTYDSSMRVLSGIKPSGSIHLGNYLGALKIWVTEQHRDTFYGVVDLHALTLPLAPEELRTQTLSTAATILAVGVDPERATLFVQSWVPYHAQLTWLLECVVSYGELKRMTQFKEKGGEQAGHRAGLFTYPVLMASDILLYDTDGVPVGEDQRQHLELARDLGIRLNNKFGDLFTVPESWNKQLDFSQRLEGVRIRSLRSPEKKMSKSIEDPSGTIKLSDTPKEAAKKIKSAETDRIGVINWDWVNQPGITNLLQIYELLSGKNHTNVLSEWVDKDRYGDLKAATAEAVSSFLTDFQTKLAAVSSEQLLAKLVASELVMNQQANQTLLRVQKAVGLRA